MTDNPRADLEAAAAAGLLQPAQVQPLAAFLEERAQGAANGATRPLGLLRSESEEPLRFVRNFQDVFLAIGIAVLGFGMMIWLFANLPAAIAVGQAGMWGPSVTAAIAAAVMWGLGEAFAYRRKQFFPAIAACIGFCVFVFWTVMFAFGALLNVTPNLEMERAASDIGFWLFFLSFASAALAGLAFYWRFRLPFSLAVVGGAFTGLLFVLAFRFVPEPSVTLFSALLLLSGLILFGLAVWFDARDPSRATRYSDNGFWLHFAAAPLVLNGALGLIVPLLAGGGQEWYTIFSLNAVSATVTLIVVAVLGIVSLLINRRALIVAALFTTGAAIAVLLNSAGLGEATVAAGALVVLGGGVLILGSGWNAARRVLLARVNPEGPWARIFPPEAVE